MKPSNTKERLIYYMKSNNLRQVDIVRLCKFYAEEYGVKFNKSDISQYVTGRAEPNQDKLYVLSKALDVDVAWLMGYDVPMKKNEDIENIIYSVSEKMNMSYKEVKMFYDNSPFSSGEYSLSEHKLISFIEAYQLVNGEIEQAYYENLSKEDSLIIMIDNALDRMNYDELQRVEQLLRAAFPDKF